jgi:autotransporter translocation and assembly factor TamB
VQLKDIQGDVKIYGSAYLEKGELQTKRVLVKLGKGDLSFSGPWNKPRINLKGDSKVEKTKISIGLKGTIEEPELTLTSEPSYSREKLMIMLATGKSWQSVEDSVDNGLNATALTKDFIDYFFFAGQSNQFAKKFGISEFSVTLDENKKGIAAKKEITDKLEVSYGVEQTTIEGQVGGVSRMLGGEVKVNDQLSVGVERESNKTQSNELFEDQINENNDKVMLKYKKSF